MRDLRLFIPFVFLMACGGAQSEDTSANHAADSEEPAAQASQPAGEAGGPEQPEDEIAALEGEDLASAGGETPPSESPRAQGGVARGRSAGGLGARRSSMPGETRRAPRVRLPETLDGEAVDATVAERRREVQFCYEREFQHRPDVSGRIVVAATIAPDGHVSEASIASSTIRNANVDRCVIQTFQRWEFPRAEAATTVDIPFTLRHH